jgi:hypothetical protein
VGAAPKAQANRFFPFPHASITTEVLKLQTPLVLVLLLAACASEGPESVEQQLRKLDADAGEGVAKISKALNDPTLSSPLLGEGSRLVTQAARGLELIETDSRASDYQQLMAIVYQARAWDDVAVAYTTAPMPASLEAGHRALLQNLLAEKAQPARVSAGAGYQRARMRACRSGFDALPVMTELLMGVSLYADTLEVSLDPPCAAE